MLHSTACDSVIAGNGNTINSSPVGPRIFFMTQCDFECNVPKPSSCDHTFHMKPQNVQDQPTAVPHVVTILLFLYIKGV